MTEFVEIIERQAFLKLFFVVAYINQYNIAIMSIW